ncbi:hypothetical protein ACFLZV_00875 [Candidatus Margulisiibacteriota bacterium]
MHWIEIDISNTQNINKAVFPRFPWSTQDIGINMMDSACKEISYLDLEQCSDLRNIEIDVSGCKNLEIIKNFWFPPKKKVFSFNDLLISYIDCKSFYFIRSTCFSFDLGKSNIWKITKENTLEDEYPGSSGILISDA